MIATGIATDNTNFMHIFILLTVQDYQPTLVRWRLFSTLLLEHLCDYLSPWYIAAEFRQITGKNVGGDGACESLFKTTGPTTWFYRSFCPFQGKCIFLHTMCMPWNLKQGICYQSTTYSWSTFVTFNQDRAGCTVEDFCIHIHKNLVNQVKYALVWGTSARHYPQHCGLSHVLHDEDAVQIVKKKVLSCSTGHSLWFKQLYFFEWSIFYKLTRFCNLLRHFLATWNHSTYYSENPIWYWNLFAEWMLVLCCFHPYLIMKLTMLLIYFQDKEEGARGRFKSHSTAPARISDREKKAPLKTWVFRC